MFQQREENKHVDMLLFKMFQFNVHNTSGRFGSCSALLAPYEWVEWQEWKWHVDSLKVQMTSPQTRAGDWVCIYATQMDISDVFLLLFIFSKESLWRCLQETAGTRALYQHITAALQFSVSLYRCSQLRLSANLFEWCIQSLFLIEGETACLCDSLTAFKRYINRGGGFL